VLTTAHHGAARGDHGTADVVSSVTRFTFATPHPADFRLSAMARSATFAGMNAAASVTVRPLRAEDRPDWAELWTAYLDFYETSVAPEIYDSTFARLLGDDPRDFSAFVAEQDGRLVGLTHYLFHRHGWKIEDVCYLQDLYARPEARGTGVGRRLIEAVYAEADARGAPTVYWLTQDFNETARKLYDRIAVKTPFIKYQRP
jgi:GNAT superfamily N-acetyltransferase